MKSTQSFGLHFTVRTDKEKDGRVPVYACVTVNRKRSYIGLKQMVDPKSWDAAQGVLRGNKEEVKTINSYLQEVRTAISTCYQQLQLKGKLVTADSVKDAFLGTHQDIFTLSYLIEYHNETATATLKWSTLKHYYVTQRYLSKFLQEKFSGKGPVSA